MTKILLAEDHQLVRKGIRNILEKYEDFVVVGEAQNGFDVIRQLSAEIDVDIVLIDLMMPGMDGLTLCRELQTKFPQTKAIILTLDDNDRNIMEAYKLGIKGFLLKNCCEEEVILSIRKVARNQTTICSELGLNMLKKALKSMTAADQSISIELTVREQEILELLSEGYTNHEISEKLFTSRRTVEGHRQNLINKTGARNTPQLVRFACKAGLL